MYFVKKLFYSKSNWLTNLILTMLNISHFWQFLSLSIFGKSSPCSQHHRTHGPQQPFQKTDDTTHT